MLTAWPLLLITTLAVSGCGSNAAASAKNVQAERSAVVADWRKLMITADGVCTSSDAVEESGPTHYSLIVADYNKQQVLLVRANESGPSGYPIAVPKVSGTDSAVTEDWCNVSNDLGRYGPTAQSLGLAN